MKRLPVIKGYFHNFSKLVYNFKAFILPLSFCFYYFKSEGGNYTMNGDINITEENKKVV